MFNVWCWPLLRGETLGRYKVKGNGFGMFWLTGRYTMQGLDLRSQVSGKGTWLEKQEKSNHENMDGEQCGIENGRKSKRSQNWVLGVFTMEKRGEEAELLKVTWNYIHTGRRS